MITEHGHPFLETPGTMTMLTDPVQLLKATISATTIKLKLRELDITLKTPEIEVPNAPNIFGLDLFTSPATTRTNRPLLRPFHNDKDQAFTLLNTINLKSPETIQRIEYPTVFALFAHFVSQNTMANRDLKS